MPVDQACERNSAVNSATLSLSPTPGFECVAELLLLLVFRFFVFSGFLVDGFTVVEPFAPSTTLTIIPTYVTSSPAYPKEHDDDEPSRNGNASLEANNFVAHVGYSCEQSLEADAGFRACRLHLMQTCLSTFFCCFGFSTPGTCSLHRRWPQTSHGYS